MAPRRNKVDVYVGERLKNFRVLAGLSQEELGRRVGLTFQQIQKYEKGANRIGAGRLYELGKILGMPLNAFYDGYEDWAQGRIVHIPGLTEPPPPTAPTADNKMHSRESLEMIRAFNEIKDEDSRDRLFKLMKAMAESEAAARR